jgi:hypothetical protein
LPSVTGLDNARDIVAQREHLTAMKRTLTSASTPINASYTEEDRQIPMRDGFKITVRIHSPKTTPPLMAVPHSCCGMVEAFALAIAIMRLPCAGSGLSSVGWLSMLIIGLRLRIHLRKLLRMFMIPYFG